MSIRVGNELGAGNAVRAKRAVYVALGVMGGHYIEVKDLVVF